MSPKHVRKNTAQYWKLKYEAAESMLKETHETSLNLEEIPGFLKVNKVKPKPSSVNHRVTQVHGSMEGKNVLKLVQDIKEQKEQKEKAKDERTEKKQMQKEAFYRCKERCVCEGVCEARGLKQCSSCHNILKSVCTKAGCRDEGGQRPMMILTAGSACSSRTRLEERFDESEDDEDIEMDYESEVDDESDMTVDESESEEGEEAAIEAMKRTWEYLSPPSKKDVIIGKWFAVSYTGKRREILYIAKLVQRFLEDKDGRVQSLTMRCLKLKVGSGTIVEDTPSHLPPDETEFMLHDVLAGPIDVIPLKGSVKFDVPAYQQIVSAFEHLKKIDREKLC